MSAPTSDASRTAAWATSPIAERPSAPTSLQQLLELGGFETISHEGENESTVKDLSTDDAELMEVVVAPRSMLVGRSARGLDLRRRYGMNVLAASRPGGAIRERPGTVAFRVGDVLLLQGPRESMADHLGALGCLPLAERGLRLGRPPRILLGMLIVGIALLVGAALGILEIHVALALAVFAMGLAGLINLREAYESIDWSVLVLLGAMIPVGQSLQDTGGAALIADRITDLQGHVPIWLLLTVLMVVTMVLSDVVNNAATAVLMSPIAFSVAGGLGASPDPFLMAVAIGASSAFLTPIGHQSNVLVMGPGGYRFGDYWRVGLPLEALVVLVSIPLILIRWPL